MKFSYDTQIRFSDVDCTNKVSLGKIVDFLQNWKTAVRIWWKQIVHGFP